MNRRHPLAFVSRALVAVAAGLFGLHCGAVLACNLCGCCRVDSVIASGSAAGEVVISEIMYDPGGTVDNGTGTGEWIELYNTGSTSIDISGWQVGNSPTNQYANAFPSGTILQPYQALVVTGNSTAFDAEWKSGINRIQVSNLPIWTNPLREVAAIRDNQGTLRDSVDFQNTGDWPRINGDNGASIFALPAGLSSTANDVGANWKPSAWGNYGAVLSSYNGENNHASPGYVASIEQPPFTPSPDAAWSMVLMPDTQNYVKASGEKGVLTNVTEWIRDNRDAFKIKAVLHEGDIVNNNNTNDPTSGNQNSTQQWQNAKASMSVLDGQVPYIMAAGNHDFGFTNSDNRDTQINTYFKATDNPLNDPAQGGILKGVKTPGEIQNAYYSFTAPDGRKMLVISLEWEPRPATVAWANQIAALPQFADHTAVLLTHAYLQGNDTRYSASKVIEDYAGNELWTGLVRQHENFEMVVNGHFGGDGQGFLRSTALPGNKVNQLFFNTQFETQGGNGWIQLVEFLQDGKTVRVRTYSPYLNQMRPHPDLDFEFQLSPMTFLAGDYNRDGRVDGADYLVWRESVGLTGAVAADGNQDGVVNQLDYIYWRFRYGNSGFGSGTGEGGSVPEPASLALLLSAGIVCSLAAGRRRFRQV